MHHAANNREFTKHPQLAVFLLVVELATACQDPQQLPDPAPVVWTGAFIELATHDDSQFCGGTRDYLDTFVGVVQDEMRLPPGDELIRYYLLSTQELEDLQLCPPGGKCTTGNRIYTDEHIDTHELLHAARTVSLGEPLPGVTFFEEGLAVMYGLNGWTVTAEKDVYAGLYSVPELRAYLPGEHYGVAGHFTRFLEGEHELDAVVDFINDQAGVRSVSALESVFAAHFDSSLSASVERYGAEYPLCSAFARTWHAVECSQDPVEPNDDGIINIKFELSCDLPDVIGPLNGRMWKSFTFEVTNPGSYRFLTTTIQYNYLLQVVDCNRGCLSSVDVQSPVEGSLYRVLDLQPGRYLMRLSRPVADAGLVGIGIVPSD